MMYCSHNDGNEAYSQVEGTYYCKGHIAQIAAMNKRLSDNIPDPSKANYSLEPSVDLRNEIKKGHEPTDRNPFRYEEEIGGKTVMKIGALEYDLTGAIVVIGFPILCILGFIFIICNR